MPTPSSSRPEINLDIDAETFEAPGSGRSVENNGAEVPGPIIFGTTCWGTPCPSADPGRGGTHARRQSTGPG